MTWAASKVFLLVVQKVDWRAVKLASLSNEKKMAKIGMTNRQIGQKLAKWVNTYVRVALSENC